MKVRVRCLGAHRRWTLTGFSLACYGNTVVMCSAARRTMSISGPKASIPSNTTMAIVVTTNPVLDRGLPKPSELQHELPPVLLW